MEANPEVLVLAEFALLVRRNSLQPDQEPVEDEVGNIADDGAHGMNYG